jgi:hypothetical protein
MAARFARGAVVYTKDGRSYTVSEVEDGIVYCTSSSGGETEFSEDALINEAEWMAKSDGRRDLFYTRLKQAPSFVNAPAKLDATAATQLLTKIEHLSPGILDFTAFRAAAQVMTDNGDDALIESLSITKSRAVFDAAKPEVRLTLLAGLLGMAPEALADAGRLGDNLMRALIEKGLASQAQEFEEFLDRPRR